MHAKVETKSTGTRQINGDKPSYKTLLGLLELLD